MILEDVDYGFNSFDTTFLKNFKEFLSFYFVF